MTELEITTPDYRRILTETVVERAYRLTEIRVGELVPSGSIFRGLIEKKEWDAELTITQLMHNKANVADNNGMSMHQTRLPR